MKNRLFVPLAIILLMLSGISSVRGQESQTNLNDLYEESQTLIQLEESKIDRYIQEQMNVPLPSNLQRMFIEGIKNHEHSGSFSELDKQNLYNQLKREHWRHEYFKKNPNSRKLYNNKVAASSCTNGDFESGNFMTYTGESAFGTANGYDLGDCAILTADPTYQTSPIVFTPEDPNTASANHFSITNPGNDPLVTTGTLPMVWNGGHSAKINADLPSWPNYGANKLIKRVVLTEVDEEIFFNYALVLEDPGTSHDGEKPTFVARILDASGNECDRICNSAYSSDPFLLNANTSGSIRYKPWSCRWLQACGQVGDTVTLEFIQTDCGQGGHWGYAYIDDICDTCTIDTCNYQGSIDLLPTDTCSGDTMQVCGTYQLAAQNCSTFAATEIRLYIQHGGAVVSGPITNTNPSGGTFCFTVTPGDLPPGVLAGTGFDFYVEIDFAVGAGTTTANDYNTNSGLDNDYVYQAECCPEFTLLTCCDLDSTLNRSSSFMQDPRVQNSIDAYKAAVQAKYPSARSGDVGCCDYCDYPDIAFPVFIYDETGTMLIDNSVYTISWSNDPSNNTAIGMVLPDQPVVVTVSGPDSCVWTQTFHFDCCDDPGLPGFCCDTIDFNVDLDSLCTFDPCDFPTVQFPIQVLRDGTVIGIPAYSFQWSNGTTGSATSASQSQLPIYVTVTDNSTGCTTVGTYDIDCDPPPCNIFAPLNLSCTLTRGGQILSWDPVPNAVSYEISFYYNDPKCCRNGTPGFITIPVPVNGTSHFVSNFDCFSWQVRAKCADGTVSAWSKSCSCANFGCLIKAPTNLRCLSSRSGQSLSWDPVSNAVSYEITFYNNDPQCCRNGNPGSITIPTPVNGTNYLVNHFGCFSWQVRAVCIDGTKSAWSQKGCSCGFTIISDDKDIKSDKSGNSQSSIDDVEESDIHYSAVPNPAKDMVTIRFHKHNADLETNNANIIISDISGRTVYNSTIVANEFKQIDVSGLSPGLYIYRIVNADKNLVIDKLVIE